MIRQRIAKTISDGSDNPDPFVLYGPGVYNYFQLMQKLLYLFFFLSLARIFKFDRNLDLSAEVARSSRPRRVHFAVPGRLDLTWDQNMYQEKKN